MDFTEINPANNVKRFAAHVRKVDKQTSLLMAEICIIQDEIGENQEKMLITGKSIAQMDEIGEELLHAVARATSEEHLLRLFAQFEEAYINNCLDYKNDLIELAQRLKAGSGE